jgi:predicted transcriptional regulator
MSSLEHRVDEIEKRQWELIKKVDDLAASLTATIEQAIELQKIVGQVNENQALMWKKFKGE